MSAQRTIETRLATIELVRPDVVVIRYHEGIHFSTDGIAEVIATCERITDDPAFGVIGVLPNDGEMDLGAMQQEHSTAGFEHRVRAHALVASDGLFKRLTEIHYAYHPQPYEIRMFTSEQEAMAWVLTVLAK